MKRRLTAAEAAQRTEHNPEFLEGLAVAMAVTSKELRSMIEQGEVHIEENKGALRFFSMGLLLLRRRLGAAVRLVELGGTVHIARRGKLVATMTEYTGKQ